MIKFPIWTHIKDILISKPLLQDIYWFTPHKVITSQGKGIWFTHDPTVHRKRSSCHELWSCPKCPRIWRNGASCFLWALHPQPAAREECSQGHSNTALSGQSLPLPWGKCLSALPSKQSTPFCETWVSWTLLFQLSNTSCCIGQSSHVPFQGESFNSPLLTSFISSLTGYAASSHFIARSWVKASGRWWA